ncbi:hypothetical protein Tco_0859714 [Tanacetum coccineum]|uniref:Uncharacterized protein n=1 Tax=Tanacetum coccineum TaxID=301880 RepID=A0ABQ5BG29_9ASTR
MNELNEFVIQDYKNSMIYKSRTKRSKSPKRSEPRFNVVIGVSSLILDQKDSYRASLRPAGLGPFTLPKVISIWHRRVISNRRAKLQGEWSSYRKKLFGRKITTKWIAPDFEASRARGFCPSFTRALILSFIMGIHYPNLID